MQHEPSTLTEALERLAQLQQAYSTLQDEHAETHHALSDAYFQLEGAQEKIPQLERDISRLRLDSSELRQENTALHRRIDTLTHERDRAISENTALRWVIRGRGTAHAANRAHTPISHYEWDTPINALDIERTQQPPQLHEDGQLTHCPSSALQLPPSPIVSFHLNNIVAQSTTTPQHLRSAVHSALPALHSYLAQHRQQLQQLLGDQPVDFTIFAEWFSRFDIRDITQRFNQRVPDDHTGLLLRYMCR